MADSAAGFCSQCGAARAAGANFCGSCGASLAGVAPSVKEATTARSSAAGIAVMAVLLAAGGASAWFALRDDAQATRSVPGAPSAPAMAAQATGQPQQDGSLPQGHPSIELPKEVVAFLDQLTAEAEKNPQDVEAQLRLARARYRASMLNVSYRQSAQQALDKLLAVDPENAEGIRISANLAYDRGEFDVAEKGFVRFLSKNPNDPSALTDLGSALLFQNRPEEAITQYRRALETDANFLQARFNLGITLQKQGKSQEALVELQKAAELAKEPEQKQHIENAIAEVEGREPRKMAPASTGMPADHPSAGDAAAGAAGRTATAAAGAEAAGAAHTPKTNATNDFQRQAETLLLSHPIVGQRIRSFEWTGAAAGRVLIGDFPMDKMPPVVRNKFKSGMNQKLTALASSTSVAEPIHLELVDPESSQTMDKLDGKEMVGAFDPQQ